MLNVLLHNHKMIATAPDITSCPYYNIGKEGRGQKSPHTHPLPQGWICWHPYKTKADSRGRQKGTGLVGRETTLPATLIQKGMEVKKTLRRC